MSSDFAQSGKLFLQNDDELQSSGTTAPSESLNGKFRMVTKPLTAVPETLTSMQSDLYKTVLDAFAFVKSHYGYAQYSYIADKKLMEWQRELTAETDATALASAVLDVCCYQVVHIFDGDPEQVSNQVFGSKTVPQWVQLLAGAELERYE